MKFAAAVCLVSATSALASVMRAEPIYARDVSGITESTGALYRRQIDADLLDMLRMELMRRATQAPPPPPAGGNQKPPAGGAAGAKPADKGAAAKPADDKKWVAPTIQGNYDKKDSTWKCDPSKESCSGSIVWRRKV